jgi:hypothetical protein
MLDELGTSNFPNGRPTGGVMAATSTPGPVVLHLLEGRSERHEIVFQPGVALPPFAVGSHASWSISAAHVDPAHVMFAFNGTRLFVCALRGAMAVLNGAPIGTHWTEVDLPSELRFGGVRIHITSHARSRWVSTIAVSNQEATRIVDLERVVAKAPPVHDKAATTLDDERLEAALRLLRSGEDVLCSAEPTRVPPTTRSNAQRPARPKIRIARKSAEPTAASVTLSESMTAALLAGLEGARARSRGPASSRPLRSRAR